MKIYYWADNTWIDEERSLEEMLEFMSDDFGILELPDNSSNEAIDAEVQHANNHH